MVYQLVMPLPRARLEIQRDDGFSKQSIPRAMAAVVIAGRQFHREKDHSEFFIDADLAPDTGIAGV